MNLDSIKKNVFSSVLARIVALFVCFFLLFPNIPSSLISSEKGFSSSKQYNEIKQKFETQYLELLMEKGVYDDQGVEIDGRLNALIQETKSKGAKSSQSIINLVLEKLNYSKTNLGNFPQCVFDRPVGYKLTQFGHTKSPGDIDATAEGSACPVGGIGAGSFELTISGNFRYWFLKLGWMVDDIVWANQFHVYMNKGNQTIAQTLSADVPPSSANLQSWRWNYPQGEGSYFALFPKSGFSYEKNDAFPAKLAVTQFSPVLPNNYRETSYPVAIYKWIAENPNNKPIEVSIMLTWENMVGWEPLAPHPESQPSNYIWDRKSPGNFNQFVEEGTKKGIIFKKKNGDLKSGNALTGTMCIATQEIPGKTKVYYYTNFDPKSDGAEVWKNFCAAGTLANSQNSRVAGANEEVAGAMAIKFILKPKERLEVPLSIAWDFPYYEFEKGVKYRKKYTEFFGASGENAWVIACEALDKYKDWEKTIDDWQKEVFSDFRFPDWLKQVLFNELYVLAETSIWDASTNLHSYLESADYLMYGTFDVDAYSSWHLLKFWPELELNNMRFFADTVGWQDPAFKSYQYGEVLPNEVPEAKKHYYWNTNKVRGMVPHDLGSPRKRPWVVLNAFDWQNGNVWKDLNPKFPLRAFRDFLYASSRDFDFLKKMFKASVVALDTLEAKFADPKSHIPLNEGIPDQTYDTWRMKGESAYVSLLWLAALKATSQMGQILINQGKNEVDDINIAKTIAKYQSWLEAGGQALEKLWNDRGGYFNIDASTDDIMTDQLFGVWCSKIIGLEKEEKKFIIPIEKVKKSLRTIYEKNVLGFGQGLLGAVNGRNAEGKQLFSEQGDEVWTGTTYAFASNCILYGLVKEGMHAAYGIYHVTYSPYGQGYFFKTPEAYCNPEEGVWNNPGVKNGEKLFRAMKYMRPGAVWAVYEALIKNK